MAGECDLTSGDIRNYPHFDAPLSLSEIRSLVTDPVRVAANTFYPFLHFEESWNPYRSGGAIKPDRKIRPIRYGARRDAYIFTYYRRKLARIYEDRLKSLEIQDCPIAYRKIKHPDGRGKSNIDFAKEAFDTIDRLRNCTAVALDIKGYFDNLDHERIKGIWCDLLGLERLPSDHYAVFKNITQYRYVDQRAVYTRLGYFGKKGSGKSSTVGFLVPYEKMPKQLCSNADFREKICGGDPVNYPSLIQKNQNSYGIPQGSPISDLIANFYLLNFDKLMSEFARKAGGVYRRYSDDILFIIPGGIDKALDVVTYVKSQIVNYGSKLEIKDKKTCIALFVEKGGSLEFKHHRYSVEESSKNGFEYLGFRYDGRRIFVRDSTISRFYRKVAGASKSEAKRHVEKNPTLATADLINSFDYSLFAQRFSKVKKENLTNEYRTWTFYSYLRRAGITFGPQGGKILQQAKGFDGFMRRRIADAISFYVSKRT